MSRQLQQTNDRLAELDERITASEGNSMQIANILKGIGERSRQTESTLNTITPAFAQLCQEFAACGNSPPQVGWASVTPTAYARALAGALMPAEAAATAADTNGSNASSATPQSDARMTEGVAAEAAEPPAKQPKTSGPVGAPPSAEADNYDSSDEAEITEQPMPKIARVGYNLCSGMAAVGAAAGSTTAPLLAALDAVSTFAHQARSAGASGDGVALARAEDTTAADGGVDALMRQISDREKELSFASIPDQRF